MGLKIFLKRLGGGAMIVTAATQRPKRKETRKGKGPVQSAMMTNISGKLNLLPIIIFDTGRGA